MVYLVCSLGNFDEAKRNSVESNNRNQAPSSTNKPVLKVQESKTLQNVFSETQVQDSDQIVGAGK